MFGGVGKKINQVLGYLELLPVFIADLKATMTVIQKDLSDVKAAQAVLTHQAVTSAIAPAVAAAVAPVIAANPTAAPGLVDGLKKALEDTLGKVLPKPPGQ